MKKRNNRPCAFTNPHLCGEDAAKVGFFFVISKRKWTCLYILNQNR